MPKITNSTIIKHATPICKALQNAGKNWTAEASAAVVVKTVLEEMGCTTELKEDSRADRAAVIAIIMPFFTAAKNYQNSYLAPSELMPKVETTEKTSVSEFA